MKSIFSRTAPPPRVDWCVCKLAQISGSTNVVVISPSSRISYHHIITASTLLPDISGWHIYFCSSNELNNSSFGVAHSNKSTNLKLSIISRTEDKSFIFRLYERGKYTTRAFWAEWEWICCRRQMRNLTLLPLFRPGTYNIFHGWGGQMCAFIERYILTKLMIIYYRLFWGIVSTRKFIK